MTRIAALLMIFSATVWAQAAKPRIAVVRVTDIYSGLESTTRLEERVRREHEEILRDQRAVELRRMIGELRELESSLTDRSNPPDEAMARSLTRVYEIKRQEAQTLQREFDIFSEERKKDINRAMIAEMRASLDLIVETARLVARERGYDLVIDSSGHTNTGVPFILYQKRAPDLTDEISAAIVDDAAQPQTE